MAEEIFHSYLRKSAAQRAGQPKPDNTLQVPGARKAQNFTVCSSSCRRTSGPHGDEKVEQNVDEAEEREEGAHGHEKVLQRESEQDEGEGKQEETKGYQNEYKHSTHKSLVR